MVGGDSFDLRVGLKNSFRNIKADMDSLKEDIRTNAKNIGDLVRQNRELREMVAKLSSDISALLEKGAGGLDSAMLKKIKKNKKELIKRRILELAEAEKYSLSEIKDVVVDKDRYCSRATFYRYVAELGGLIDEIVVGGRFVAVPLKR